jgi:hypothetical protein
VGESATGSGPVGEEVAVRAAARATAAFAAVPLAVSRVVWRQTRVVLTASRRAWASAEGQLQKEVLCVLYGPNITGTVTELSTLR